MYILIQSKFSATIIHIHALTMLYKNAALGTRSHSTRIIKTQSNTNVLDQTGPFCRVGGDELGTVSFLSGVSLA